MNMGNIITVPGIYPLANAVGTPLLFILAVFVEPKAFDDHLPRQPNSAFGKYPKIGLGLIDITQKGKGGAADLH